MQASHQEQVAAIRSPPQDIIMVMSGEGRPRVRFSPNSEMVLVTKLSEGPYKRDLWFTEDELDLFKANMTASIGAVRLHIARRGAPSAEVILGMEKFLTPQLTDEYKLRRARVAREVLREAQWQRARGGHGGRSVALLARIAADHTKWARERARAAALFLKQDQEAERRRELEETRGRGSSPPIAASPEQWRRRDSVQEPKRSRTTRPPRRGFGFVRSVSLDC